MWKGGAPLWQLRGLKWEWEGPEMKAAPPNPHIYKLSCAMYEQIRAVWNTGTNKRKKDEIPNLDAVSSAMERQQAYLSSLNLNLCVRLLEVHLNDISRVRLHLKA